GRGGAGPVPFGDPQRARGRVDLGLPDLLERARLLCGDGAGDDLALLAAGRGHQHHARPGRDQGGEQRAGGERFVVGVRVDGEDGRGVLEQLPRRGDRHGGVAGEGGGGGQEAAGGAV